MCFCTILYLFFGPLMKSTSLKIIFSKKFLINEITIKIGLIISLDIVEIFLTYFVVSLKFLWLECLVKGYNNGKIISRRCIKSVIKLQYFGNSWDEWVGIDRLMKYTEENIVKQQALDKKQGVDKNPKSGRSTQTKPKVLNGIFPLVNILLVIL